MNNLDSVSLVLLILIRLCSERREIHLLFVCTSLFKKNTFSNLYHEKSRFRSFSFLSFCKDALTSMRPWSVMFSHLWRMSIKHKYHAAYEDNTRVSWFSWSNLFSVSLRLLSPLSVNCSQLRKSRVSLLRVLRFAKAELIL